ncbi:MAG: ABC transporter permease [Acidobacteriota bacterium]
MLQSYFKLAVKVLLRRKFFTFISLFAVSATLLVLLVAAAMLDGVFGPRAPEIRSDRTLGAYLMSMSGPDRTRTAFPGFAFLDQQARNLPGVERMTVFSVPSSVASYPDGRKVSSFLKRTDGDYWKVLDFTFLEGGPYSAEDDVSGNSVAVINATTRRRFFGEASALGKTLEADGQSFRVVGVVPDVPFVRVAPFADIWVPIGTARTSGFRHDLVGEYMALFLASDRSALPGIRAAFQERLRNTPLPDPKMYDTLHGGADSLFDSAARILLTDRFEDSRPERLRALLLGLAVAFMLLPALNLANINLSRILERSSEIGVRKAFGASARTLVGQFLVENVVLTLVGAALGLVFAAATLAAINRSGLIPYAQFTVSLRVFAWAVGMALFFGILSGVLPAWRMSRMHAVQALRGSSL